MEKNESRRDLVFNHMHIISGSVQVLQNTQSLFIQNVMLMVDDI